MVLSKISKSFYTLDVFTQTVFGGNPLAVFPEATGLTTTHMQQIAKEFNLSETVFVLPPKNPSHSHRLRIFTPKTELAFAGHPTVGTAYLLAAIGIIPLSAETTKILLEEKVGIVPVEIKSKNGDPIYSALTASKMPEYGPLPPEIAKIAAVLGLDTTDIRQDHFYPEAVSCGLPFLFIPVSHSVAIDKIKLNLSLWQQWLADYWAPHLYTFFIDTQKPTNIQARMFAPGLGIEEDPATGSAATALAGYLSKRQLPDSGNMVFKITQGLQMGRPSLIRVETDVENSKVTAIKVGGSSVIVSNGQFYLADA